MTADGAAQSKRMVTTCRRPVAVVLQHVATRQEECVRDKGIHAPSYYVVFLLHTPLVFVLYEGH